MSEEAATPTGGAEVPAQAATAQPQAKPSTHERLKASLFGAAPEPKEKPEQAAAPETAERAPKPEVKAEAKPKEQPEPEVSDEAEPSEEEGLTAAELRTLNELAEATGLELDRLMDLDIPTKIDGKDGAARLRDLVKSYQLEGHLTQKLQAHADEKKAFELETQRAIADYNAKVQSMGALQQLAERLLHGEFAATDWDALRAQDPLTYNAKVVEFQERQRQVQHMADQLGQENQRTKAEAAKQQQAYFAEQVKLLDSKIPEWSDKARRSKDEAEMVSAASDAYGYTEAEVRGIVDHRQVLTLRDALKWQALQKSKPAALNKVKTAPKLLKPGTPQSREAQNSLQIQQDRAKLRQTGKLSDATKVLKRQLFN